MATESNDTALADTHARLLALEMVTAAVLNQIAVKDPEVQDLLRQLAAPRNLPDAEAAGGADTLEHLQTNVARLAEAIAGPL